MFNTIVIWSTYSYLSVAFYRNKISLKMTKLYECFKCTLKNHPDTYTAEGRAADKLFSPFSKQYPYHYYQNSRTD